MVWNWRKTLLVAMVFLPLCAFGSGVAGASQIHKNKHHKKQRSHHVSSQVAKDKFSALVVDANTGKILYENNADATHYPASLTKMMTLYLTFDALKSGKLKMNDYIPVSAKAAGQVPTNINLNAGDSLPVRTAIESIIVRSANDSAMALAEALGSNENNFANMMIKKARLLGMSNTIFRNPNGLPNPKQITTAYDMARLGIALRRDFPQYYPMFKLTEFTYNGVTYQGHNHVMARYDGVDGIKTGYIRASGFNLVTSVKRDDYSLVGVVMGGTSIASRDDAMIEMLDNAFAKLESQPVQPKRVSTNETSENTVGDSPSNQTVIKTSRNY
jgi:D-alanyl-D-alanine carboxypeptidase